MNLIALGQIGHRRLFPQRLQRDLCLQCCVNFASRSARHLPLRKQTGFVLAAVIMMGLAAWQQNADGGLARRHDRPARHSNCGHDRQRKSVAHMPTASATTANLRYGRMIEAETETAEISN